MPAFDLTMTAAKLVCGLLNRFKIICILLHPFLSTFLTIYVNRKLLDTVSDISGCLIGKFMLDYFRFIVDRKLVEMTVRSINHEIKTKMRRSVYKCGVSLSGDMSKLIDDLYHDESKLHDFIIVIPALYHSIVSFTIMICSMKADFQVRVVFGLFCIIMCAGLTYITDSSVYEKVKPPADTVIKTNDPNYVKIKLAMGCSIDEDFEERKRIKIQVQQEIQKWVIILVNLTITYISIKAGNVAQIHSFGTISNMIGILADNIKSLKYSPFVIEYFAVSNCLEQNAYKSENEVKIGNFRTVKCVNTSFGYYSDLMTNPTRETKISNFNFTFRRGKMYYLEAPNATGKSTLLRMFKLNLFGGDIMFGDTNRKNLSFETLNSLIFHVNQASEYTPKFTKNEYAKFKEISPKLANQLGITEIFNKDMVELNGGAKKKLLIGLALLSNCPIVLFDETLTELSTSDGCLPKLISTLSDFVHDKIIILVGHGLSGKIPRKFERFTI